MKVADKLILKFPVLWEGWECDSTAWVYEMQDGSRYLLVGSSEDRRNAESLAFLEGKIAEYEAALEGARTALELLNGIR
jgi:hypothetical protein